MSPQLYDRTDRALLAQLRMDSALRIREYVARTGIPRSTVHERLRRLVRGGVRCTALLDQARVGFPLSAFYLLPFSARAVESPYVNTAQRLAPDLLFLECFFPSMKALEAFKEEIGAQKCLLVVETLKREGFVPYEEASPSG